MAHPTPVPLCSVAALLPTERRNGLAGRGLYITGAGRACPRDKYWEAAPPTSLPARIWKVSSPSPALLLIDDLPVVRLQHASALFHRQSPLQVSTMSPSQVKRCSITCRLGPRAPVVPHTLLRALCLLLLRALYAQIPRPLQVPCGVAHIFYRGGRSTRRTRPMW